MYFNMTLKWSEFKKKYLILRMFEIVSLTKNTFSRMHKSSLCQLSIKKRFERDFKNLQN